ncbi:HutD family protein [Bdellovibrio sp. ArHS]|uniref:HutD/Ves family protein n=1 Tax=Bdellovibrio sp. ArHS TaxID=1569284 RepID=UPI000AA6010C|nr:HutD family protein [Bdellovibrio sp. ArHS]
MKMLRKADYKIMPWKNGMGETSQIDIYPESANFPDGDFLWRLSSAKVAASAPFSKFENCDRLLAVWKGKGLKLNEHALPPLTPYKFSGDSEMQGVLQDGEVLDLGIVYRRGKVSVDMTSQEFTKEVTAITLESGIHYFFCASGSMAVGQNLLEEGDTVRVDGAQTVKLSGKVGTPYFHIVVRPH